MVGKPNACGVCPVREARCVSARCTVVGDRPLTDTDTGSSRGLIGVLVLSEVTRADLRFGAPMDPHCLIDSLNDLLPEGFPSREPQGLVLYEEELE